MSPVNRSAFASAARGGGGARKSPLRLAADPVPVVSAGSSQTPDVLAGGGFRRADISPAQRRQVMISEYGEWLRSQTNRHGRPFQPETISAYRDAAVALSSWMTSAGLEADFTGCDTAALNRFSRAYLAAHSQGRTNTKQRNLRHLFSWLAIEYGHPHPYTDKLVRYTPVRVRPSTLAADFIRDLLSATGGGRARAFEDARDHAMIRVLTEGVRRGELVQIRLDDLPADLIARPYIRVVPLKGARAADEGRIVPLTPATAKAIVVCLRARRSHGLAEDLAGVVAWDSESRAGDWEWRVADGQAAGRGGWVRAVGVPAYVPAHVRARPVSRAAGLRVI
jgi:site-specific recombinase XerD